MKTSVIIPVLLLVAGCSALSKPYPDKNLHALRLGDPPAGQVSAPSALLKVDRVRIAEPYDGTTFIYQTGDSSFTSDYYNGFIAPPARLITGELSSFLGKCGLFKTVLGGDSSADYQLTLETNVISMYGDYRQGQKPQAVIAARFFVLDETKGHYDVVFDKTYSQTTPIDQKGSDALVKAWESGWTNLLTELTKDLSGASAVMNVGAKPATEESAMRHE